MYNICNSSFVEMTILTISPHLGFWWQIMKPLQNTDFNLKFAQNIKEYRAVTL